MFEATNSHGETTTYPSLDACARANRPDFIQNALARESIDVEDLFAHLAPHERRLAIQHLYAIGLTNGCNGRCTFCGDDARPGITKQLSFKPLVALINEFLADEEISCCIKSCLVLHSDTDPLDYAEISPSGHTIHDIFDVEAARHFQCRHFPASQDITHLPLHAIPALKKHMTNNITKMIKDGRMVDKLKMTVSVTERNREMIRVFIDEIIEELMVKLKIHKNGPDARDKFRTTFLRQEAPYIFADKTITGDFHPYAIQSTPIRQWMSHVGRNFPRDDTPINALIVHWRTGEGTKITPEGLKTVLNILPTSQNPTGRLTLPILSGKGIFRRSETLTFEEALRGGRNTPLILPALSASIVGYGDRSHILTPENRLLREAYCLRMLANTLTIYTPFALAEALRKTNSHDAFQGRLNQSSQILAEYGDGGRVSTYIRQAIEETTFLFNQRDNLRTPESRRQYAEFFVNSQSGFPAELAKSLL